MQSRIRAFLVHLSGSCLVLGAFALIVLFWWYPAPMLSLQGGWEIWLMILTVDLILGPTLTGIVYVPGKKGLYLDLSVIVILQISALSYGILSIHAQRPNYLAFTLDRFYVVSLADTVGELPKNMNFPHWRGSTVVATISPEELTTSQSLDKLVGLSEGNLVPPIAITASDARPYPDKDGAWQRSYGKPMAEIENSDARKNAEKRTLELGFTADQILIYRVIGRNGIGYALVSAHDGNLQDIVGD